MSARVASLVVVALAVTACRAPRIEEYERGRATTGPTSATERDEASAVVLAEVYGDVIDLAEYERWLGQLSEPARVRLGGATARRQLLEALIAMRLLGQAADRAGFGSDPEVAYRERIGLANAVGDRLAASQAVSVGPDELAEAYERYAYRYRRSEQRELALLLTTDIAAAWRSVETYQRRLERDPASSFAAFDGLIAELGTSDAGSGQLGFVTREDLAAVAAEGVVEAAFQLEATGAITQPIEVAAGWAVFQLRQTRLARNQALEDAAEELRDELRDAQREVAVQEAVARLRAEAEIEVDEDLLRALEDARRSAGMGLASVRAPWEDLADPALNERLTPRRDLSMLGGRLADPPDEPANDGAAGHGEGSGQSVEDAEEDDVQ